LTISTVPTATRNRLADAAGADSQKSMEASRSWREVCQKRGRMFEYAPGKTPQPNRSGALLFGGDADPPYVRGLFETTGFRRLAFCRCAEETDSRFLTPPKIECGLWDSVSRRDQNLVVSKSAVFPTIVRTENGGVENRSFRPGKRVSSVFAISHDRALHVGGKNGYIICHSTRKGIETMKKEIHPKYQEATITCACGSVITTRSTVKE